MLELTGFGGRSLIRQIGPFGEIDIAAGFHKKKEKQQRVLSSTDTTRPGKGEIRIYSAVSG
ncbi:MAG TPA: hypothetical protein VM166_04945 [Gemmatimonadaceae bacterium]|nr:hypothetical protein [Gemmatimonadaceae bacterium]